LTEITQFYKQESHFQSGSWCLMTLREFFRKILPCCHYCKFSQTPGITAL